MSENGLRSRMSESMRRWAPVVGTLLAVSLAIWLQLGYRESRERLREAQRRLAECRRLSNQIRRLESMPTFAAVGADSQSSIARRIERALEDSHLSEEAVLRIQPPAQPYRLGESPYQVYPTRIELKGVTLVQVVDFAYALNDAENGLTVTDLRLWAPRGETPMGRETWSVEVTLTQLAFSPKNR